MLARQQGDHEEDERQWDAPAPVDGEPHPETQEVEERRPRHGEEGDPVGRERVPGRRSVDERRRQSERTGEKEAIGDRIHEKPVHDVRAEMHGVKAEWVRAEERMQNVEVHDRRYRPVQEEAARGHEEVRHVERRAHRDLRALGQLKVVVQVEERAEGVSVRAEEEGGQSGDRNEQPYRCPSPGRRPPEPAPCGPASSPARRRSNFGSEVSTGPGDRVISRS